MKILLFAGRFEVRGSSAYTLRLARHLREQEIDARIVCPDARQVEGNRRAELQIREFPHLQVPLWGRVVLDAVRDELEENPPDLIHIQSWNMLWQGTWLARKLKRPFVLTMHDFLPAKARFRFNRTWGQRVIAVSDAVRSDLIARTGLPRELVKVIHSGVDVPENDQSDPVLEPGHTPVVGTAGPLEAVKGLPYFLGAAQRVLTERPQVEFLISGAGPEEGNLRRLTRELGITDHVTFAPGVHDFSQPIAAMDIFCLPSLRQGLGTIMLEAMALGKPVIATSVGGVYSIIRDNETGLMVAPKDSAHLARRMLELLNDPIRARAIAEAGRQTVLTEFNVEKMVSLTVALYRQILGTSDSADTPADRAADANQPVRAT